MPKTLPTSLRLHRDTGSCDACGSREPGMPGVPKNHSPREGGSSVLSVFGFESLLWKEAEFTAPHPVLARAEAPTAEVMLRLRAGHTG